MGQNYTPYMSNLYPYSSVSAFDTDWADRPLFLDPNNIKQGWEGDIRYDFAKTWAVKVRAYGGETFMQSDEGPDSSVSAGPPVWVVTLCKQLGEGVSADLTYGFRHYAGNEDYLLNTVNELDIHHEQMLRLGLNVKL